MDNVTTVDYSNSTNADGWNYQAVLRITFGIIQSISNFSMLVLILTLREYRNAFTVYVAALFIANLIFVSVAYPMDVLRIVYSEFSFSSSLCTFHLYMLYVFAVVRLHMHLLITVNRLWAIQFPVHYRNKHSTKIACLICLGTVLYVHTLITPLLIIDLLYYRESTSGCGLASDRSQLLFIYEVAVQFIADDLLVIVIIGAFPFLCYKRLRANMFRDSNSTDRTSGSRAFILLTLLTLGIVVTSAPTSIYTTMMYFVSDYQKYSGFQRIASVLSSLLPVIDPIVFGFSLVRGNIFMAKLTRGMDRPVGDHSPVSRSVTRM